MTGCWLSYAGAPAMRRLSPVGSLLLLLSIDVSAVERSAERVVHSR